MNRKLFIVFSSIILVLVLAAGILYMVYRSGALREAVVNRVIDRVVPQGTTSTLEQTNLIKHFLGFPNTQTYLVLFLNNTELRPAGGFIGVYGVVQLEKGIPHVVKVEGTEVLDLFGPQDFPADPPKPLKDYLGITRWGFRDSNWNPDFAKSSIAGLDLYTKERGVGAQSINTVVGITPTVLEELLKIIGPFTYDGQTFTSENFTEKLEYEVEHAYKDKGVSKTDRKKILEGLTKEILKKVSQDIFSHWSDYLSLVERMLAEKHIMLYALDTNTQDILRTKQWAGTVAPPSPQQDYLLWVDANMGAWKTDHALNRTLSYTLTPTSSGYIASVTMYYTHSGLNDWRTTNYVSYTRLYVPKGSSLVRVDNTRKGMPIDKGEENGYQWFGTLTGVPIGKTGSLTFTYRVSPAVAARIKNGDYNLLIQKQNGTIAHALTLDLDFGRRVLSATPGEVPSRYGDTRYSYETDLRIDRSFGVGF